MNVQSSITTSTEGKGHAGSISTQAVNTTLDIVNMGQDKNNGKIQIFASEQFLLFNGSISSSVD